MNELDEILDTTSPEANAMAYGRARRAIAAFLDISGSGWDDLLSMVGAVARDRRATIFADAWREARDRPSGLIAAALAQDSINRAGPPPSARPAHRRQG